MKSIIIQASSRSNGNTQKVVTAFNANKEMKVLDLSSKNIQHFDYAFENQKDDFYTIISEVITSYDAIILASPIYWYSISGMLKVFLDRFSDLIIIHKELGRKLKGKKIGLLLCSSDSEEFPEIAKSIERTANYLDMEFVGAIHTWVNAEGSIDALVKKKLEKYQQIFRKEDIDDIL